MSAIRVGVDIGGTKALLVAFTGAEVASVRRVGTGPSFRAPDLERELASFIAALPAAPKSVGVAVPGIVDARGRVVACDVLPGLDGWLLALPGVKTAALNDTAAALLGARQDFAPGTTAALVMVGTAIGAAFQMNGVVAAGAKGWAGELGYMPIQSPSGTRHLDAVAGGAALLDRCGLSASELSARLAEGDQELRGAVRAAGHALGLALATLVNLLNPDLIVLGGGTLSYAGYVDAALESAQAWSFPALWECCHVSVSPHGDRLVALGAAIASAAGA